jgi:glycosyltransferase involved in cell wall biosynthesis
MSQAENSSNVIISVVLPTFNRAGFISRSISSVLFQSMREIELIIVDDCSTDNTTEVVNKFNDQRIKYIKLDKNVGGAEARNIGARLATGDYLAFQDSDDEWTCLKLSKSLQIFDTKEDVDCIFTSLVQLCGARSVTLPRAFSLDYLDNFYEYLLTRNVVDTPTFMVKRSLFFEVGGFDSSMPRYQDWDLVLRMSRVAKFDFINEPLLISYCTEGSISENKIANRDALQKIYNKHREAIDNNCKLNSLWLSNIGDSLISTGDIAGRRYLFKALRYSPFNINILTKALLSVTGSSRLYNKSISSLKELKSRFM